MAKKMKLRRDGVCCDCQKPIPVGTTAHWFAEERTVRCVDCFEPVLAVDQLSMAHSLYATASGGPVSTESTFAVESVQSATALVDLAGGSAQLEYEKRSARELAKKEQAVVEDAEWREAFRNKHPVVGRVATAFTAKPKITPESQPTKAWQIGAEGERRVAEVLAEVPGLEVLHDRLVPGSRANIDHIAVGPSGVFVIDAKKYTGKIEVRDVGSLFRADLRLYVKGRDRTKLVDGMLGQMEVVRTALGEEFADVEINGVLCFVGCEWGLIKRAKRVKGVTSLWPTALPDHVSSAGELDERITHIAERLRGSLRPAT